MERTQLVNTNVITEEQRGRLANDWCQMAGEPVKIQCTTRDQPIFAYGSELACLRLYYRMNSRGRVAYSANMDTWYYCNQ
jgi:hypothetical protein